MKIILSLSLLFLISCSEKSSIIENSHKEFKPFLNANYKHPVTVSFEPPSRGPSSFGHKSSVKTKCVRNKNKPNRLEVNKIWWYDLSSPEERERVLTEELERCSL